jgi:hypothetical protein
MEKEKLSLEQQAGVEGGTAIDFDRLRSEWAGIGW